MSTQPSSSGGGGGASSSTTHFGAIIEQECVSFDTPAARKALEGLSNLQRQHILAYVADAEHTHGGAGGAARPTAGGRAGPTAGSAQRG